MGVVVSWTSSNTFASVAREQAGHAPSDGGKRVMVQAAVAGTLVQQGHTVTEQPDGGDLVVLADPVRVPEGGEGRACGWACGWWCRCGAEGSLALWPGAGGVGLSASRVLRRLRPAKNPPPCGLYSRPGGLPGRG